MQRLKIKKGDEIIWFDKEIYEKINFYDRICL